MIDPMTLTKAQAETQRRFIEHEQWKQDQLRDGVMRWADREMREKPERKDFLCKDPVSRRYYAAFNQE